MGERKVESASARRLHRLKGCRKLVLVEAWLGALGDAFPPIIKGYLEDKARRTAFTVTLNR
jgi:hypothetical protein